MLVLLAVALAAAGPPSRPAPPRPPPPSAADVDLAAARILQRATSAEPPIDEVQRAAAAHAAPAAPSWASRARLAALVPRVSADGRFDDRRARVVGLTGSSEVDYLRDTPGYVLGLRLSWELPELVFSDAELRVAAQLQALAKARADAVAKATKVYYERQRLRVALAAGDPADGRERAEAELRLLETAAELDALTAGAFTGSTR